MPDRPDVDEPFSLHPLEGEDVLRRLLGVEDDEEEVPESVPTEDDDS
jgi:hypothetical protein